MRLEYSVSCSSVARHAQDIIRYDTTTINGFWRLEYFKRSCIEGPAYLMEGFSASWIHIMEEAFGLIYLILRVQSSYSENSPTEQVC